MWRLRSCGMKVNWRIQKHGRSLSRLVVSDQRFREATMDDKAEVLSLCKNAFQGLDKLPDYFDFFIHDRNRRCIVGEIDSKIVSFVVTATIDGGQTMFGHAGRVLEHYWDSGLFSELLQQVNNQGRDTGCKQRVAMVEQLSNKYARSEKFHKSHVEIASKLQLARMVTIDSITSSVKNDNKTSSQLLYDIKESHTCELGDYFSSEKIHPVLFPQGRLIVDLVPYRAMPENMCLLTGRNTRFFSNVQQSESGITGVLSAGTWFKCGNPPATYCIDIFGNDINSLEKHFLVHLLRALKIISSEFCLQLFVERGDVADTLCEICTKYGVLQSDRYIKGGVSVWTIVEEPYN